MRWTLSVLLLPSLACADDDAEKRIRAMEKKLESAKAILVTFEARAEGLRESGTFKGTLTVTEGNKMHLEGSIEMKGKSVNWKKVSDGAKTTEEGLDRSSHTTSKTLTDDYRRSLTHGGFIMGFYMSSAADGEEFWPAFRVSDFELGKPDNVGTRRAQIVACKLTPVAKGEKKVDISFSESIWLDMETNLPLKRVFTGNPDGKKITFTETYEKFVLDPKVDAKLFELPK
jgi:outer membrane lipoprotein-sorting protein